MEGSRKGGKEREEKKEGRNGEGKEVRRRESEKVGEVGGQQEEAEDTAEDTAEDATAEARRRKLEELPHGPDENRHIVKRSRTCHSNNEQLQVHRL